LREALPPNDPFKPLTASEFTRLLHLAGIPESDATGAHTSINAEAGRVTINMFKSWLRGQKLILPKDEETDKSDSMSFGKEASAHPQLPGQMEHKMKQGNVQAAIQQSGDGLQRNLPSTKRRQSGGSPNQKPQLPNLAGSQLDVPTPRSSSKRGSESQEACRLPPVDEIMDLSTTACSQPSNMGSSMRRWNSLYAEDKAAQNPMIKNTTGPTARNTVGIGDLRLPSLPTGQTRITGRSTTQGWNSKVAEHEKRLRQTKLSLQQTRGASTARDSKFGPGLDLSDNMLEGYKTVR